LNVYAQEAQRVYNFKKHGTGADGIKAIVTAAAKHFGCDAVVACPGHTTDETALQTLFGATLRRVAEVESRKYNHEAAIDFTEEVKTVELPDGFAARKVLVVDDVVTTGKSMRFFCGVFEALGMEAVGLCLGLNYKLNPAEADFELELPEAALTATGSPTSDFAIKVERQRVALERGKIQLEIDKSRLGKIKADEEADAGATRDNRFEKTIYALALRFGIGKNTMAGLMKNADAPRRHGKKGYMVTEWGAWMLRRREMPEAVEAGLRLKNANAEEILRSRKMANDERAGKMMPVEKVAAYVRRYSKEVADAIASVRERAAMRGLDAGLLKSAEEMSAEVNHIISERLAEWPA